MLLGWAAQAGIQEAIKTSIGTISSVNWKSIFSKGKTIAEQLSQQETYELYLEKHLYATMKMRTIHSADRDVLLNQIYHPLTITDRKNASLIKDGFVRQNNEITNIIGYAGQGKSTILRKIFLESLICGNKIPFFMELRRIESDGVIKNLISILDQLRIKAAQEDVENLLESGNVLLLLDGFDEVKTEYRSQLLKEIFHLNKKYNTQIIITSRHDTEICREAGVSNFYVKSIVKNDIIAIIEKLDHYQNTDVKDYFNISEILKNNRSLVETINTPLLATLFYVCYPHLDSVPENAIDFYDCLFATLYSRHDTIKNYTREKKANLDKNQAYQCFCALCFLSIYENQYDFTETSIVKYVQKALQIVNINDIAVENILDDFIDITSLIQRDGYDHIVFLHKSVQEYHAAQFIRNSSINRKINILSTMYKKIKDGENNLYQVCTYLYFNSKQDVIVNIFLPLCKDIGFDYYENNKKIIIENYYSVLKGMDLTIKYQNLDKISLRITTQALNYDYKEIIILEALSSLTYYPIYKNSKNIYYDDNSEIYEVSSLSSKLMDMTSDFFNDILSDNVDYYTNLFYSNTCYNIKDDHIVFRILLKELISYLDYDDQNRFITEIEKLIDQLYSDTYVQYLKETQQEKDNLMELLHLE